MDTLNVVPAPENGSLYVWTTAILLSSVCLRVNYQSPGILLFRQWGPASKDPFSQLHSTKYIFRYIRDENSNSEGDWSTWTRGKETQQIDVSFSLNMSGFRTSWWKKINFATERERKWLSLVKFHQDRSCILLRKERREHRNSVRRSERTSCFDWVLMRKEKRGQVALTVTQPRKGNSNLLLQITYTIYIVLLNY